MFRPKIIVVTGPTATGKTALGALLAKNMGGEVVSADSMQVYRGMDIGTAKPTPPERLGVPHHMIDIVSPEESYSVARYISDASACIDGIIRRGSLPVLVGGTGLYIDSLLSGRTFAAYNDPGLRRSLEAEYDEVGGQEMLLRLGGFDRESAARLHSNDKKRIVRAFEVYKATGKTISQHDLETKSIPPRYDAYKFALDYEDRAALYHRIGLRVDAMLSSGLFEEVRGLLDAGIPQGCTAMQAIGYKEMSGAVLGRCSVGEAVDEIKMESRRYAKRQLTWLRRDPDVKWTRWGLKPDIECAAKRILCGMNL